MNIRRTCEAPERSSGTLGRSALLGNRRFQYPAGMRTKARRPLLAVMAVLAVFVLASCQMSGIHAWSASAGQYYGDGSANHLCPGGTAPEFHTLKLGAHNSVGIHIDGTDFPAGVYRPSNDSVGPIGFTSRGCFTVWIMNLGPGFDAGNWFIDKVN